jgi:hypothetical protein
VSWFASAIAGVAVSEPVHTPIAVGRSRLSSAASGCTVKAVRITTTTAASIRGRLRRRSRKNTLPAPSPIR